MEAQSGTRCVSDSEAYDQKAYAEKDVSSLEAFFFCAERGGGGVFFVGSYPESHPFLTRSYDPILTKFPRKMLYIKNNMSDFEHIKNDMLKIGYIKNYRNIYKEKHRIPDYSVQRCFLLPFGSVNGGETGVTWSFCQ